MEFILWGAGDRGERILPHIGHENVLAIIDKDVNKQGKKLEGIDIISYDEFKRMYYGKCIILTTAERTLAGILEKEGYRNYLYMNDCPEDFQSPNPRNILKNSVMKLFQAEKNYVIYGNNLYAIILYQWGKDKLGDGKLEVVTGENISDELFVTFNKCCDGNVRKKFVKEDNEKILLNTDKNQGIISSDEFKDIVQLARYSEHIGEYRNHRIEKFENIHRGEKCFIIGLGSSLRYEDLDYLYEKKQKCFSMNLIHKAYNKTKWRPDYYVAQDVLIANREKQVFDYLDGIDAFISDGSKSFCQEQHTDNIYINHMACYGYEDEEMPFSEDFAQICYMSGTVAYACIQLAVYMGFSEIYLYGIDFSGLGKTCTHFFECETDGEEYTTAHQFYVCYMSAKKYAEQHGIRIWNASRGGDLEIFDRIKLEDIVM